jgi:hypothetical protein
MIRALYTALLFWNLRPVPDKSSYRNVAFLRVRGSGQFPWKQLFR